MPVTVRSIFECLPILLLRTPYYPEGPGDKAIEIEAATALVGGAWRIRCFD